MADNVRWWRPYTRIEQVDNAQGVKWVDHYVFGMMACSRTYIRVLSGWKVVDNG